MIRKDLPFSSLFFLTMILLVYFLGASITGNVVQSMYCEEDECKELCNYISDCSDITRICCDKGGFGVCEEPLLCEKSFELSPTAETEFDINYDIKELSLQKPGQIKKSKSYLIIVGLLFLAILLGVLYSYKTYKKKK